MEKSKIILDTRSIFCYSLFMLEKKNQKLKDRNLPYTVIEIESNQYLVYKCDKGHIFEANEYRILNGKSKCPECNPGQGIRKTHKSYEIELMHLHSDLWPIEVYKGIDTKINHTCINDHIHSIIPYNVLKGVKCPICSGMAKYTNETYIQKLIEKGITHRPVGKINGVAKHLLHRCGECALEWEVKPQDIMNNSGCPRCAKQGFNKFKPAKLYYVRLSDGDQIMYKIGVTSQEVYKRLWSIKLEKKILMEKQYETGAEALAAEQMILEEYKDCLIYAPQFIPSGYTELFKYDILGLDHEV